MVYEILLLVGGIGLLAQLAFGFMHAGGHGGHAGVHAGNGHAGAHTAVHQGHTATHGNVAHSHSDHHGEQHNDSKGSGSLLWLNLISPLNLFSVALGAGLIGLVLRNRLENPVLVAVAAAIGGILFFSLLVSPLKSFILKFASKPAETLTGAVAQQVEAVSRFDKQGRGLVQAVVDGQVVQVLAHLESEDRQPQAATIAPGERLVVTAVDASKNVVHVTRMG